MSAGTIGEQKQFTDFVQVLPNLFLGSHPEPQDAFDLGFSVVVCLAERPSTGQTPPRNMFIHWPIKDGPVPNPPVLERLSALINACLDAGATVFVHCNAGMNRSALVVGKVLTDRGMSAREPWITFAPSAGALSATSMRIGFFERRDEVRLKTETVHLEASRFEQLADREGEGSVDGGTGSNTVFVSDPSRIHNFPMVYSLGSSREGMSPALLSRGIPTVPA